MNAAGRAKTTQKQKIEETFVKCEDFIEFTSLWWQFEIVLKELHTMFWGLREF